MADPVIAPATPTVVQPSQGPVTPPAQVDTSPGIDQVQAAFDKVFPEIKTSPTPKEPTSKTPPATSTPQKPPEIPPPPAQTEQTEEKKLPSFLEEALKVEPSQAAKPEVVADDFPEELPDAKNEEFKKNWKNWREKYKALKDENKALKERKVESVDHAQMEYLRNQNKELQTTLSRYGVEQNEEFQNQILKPLTQAWYEAARIVKESGRDPNDLARALALSGKTQFEALDELFEGMPESAKAEAHDAIRMYRRYEQARQGALRDAPKTFEAIRRKEMERQYQALTQQQEEMKQLFDNAVKRLREDGKVEVLQRSNDPDAGWWNDQAKAIEENSRKLYLENTDMGKMAMACLLASMTDTYRKMWMAERMKRTRAESTLKDKFGAEPSLSESTGPGASSSPEFQLSEDLKRPFNEVFLREFHKSAARNR